MANKKYLIYAGVVVIGGIGIWILFKRNTTTNLIGTITDAPRKIGSLLGFDSPVVSKSEAQQQMKAMRAASSPVPPHSPTVRQSTSAQGSEIARMYQNLAKSRTKSQKNTTGATVRNSKGSIQADPHLTRAQAKAILNKPSTTSRPVSKQPIKPKVSAEAIKRLDDAMRSQRAMDREIMDIKRNRRRRFY